MLKQVDSLLAVFLRRSQADYQTDDLAMAT